MVPFFVLLSGTNSYPQPGALEAATRVLSATAASHIQKLKMEVTPCFCATLYHFSMLKQSYSALWTFIEQSLSALKM